MDHTFHMFAERDFDDVSRSVLERLKARIYGENKNYLLNINRTEYRDHLVSEFEVSPLALDFEAMTTSSAEKMIPAEQFLFNFHVYAGKSCPRCLKTSCLANRIREAYQVGCQEYHGES
jgi:hypothetical protein